MKYKEYSLSEFFKEISTEERARELVWQSRFGKAGFKCSQCSSEKFYQLKSRPEVRECQSCNHQMRLRAGTIFQKSKISMLNWVRAIYLMMQGKRGVSALELQRQLKMTRYETAWGILQKIRKALCERDEHYQISGIIELDGTFFGKKHTSNHQSVLIGIETKSWIDSNGKPKSKAGFAKVVVAREAIQEAQDFADANIAAGSLLKIDGSHAFVGVRDFKLYAQKMRKDKDLLDKWQPWVHKFISNAKTWVLGTHHGVRAAYLPLYLGEYTYRFNRRHDTKKLFDRALTACAGATPTTLPALTG